MHPIIENVDELPSPPKRHKPNDYQITSQRKFITPRKLVVSPRKLSEKDKPDAIEINITDAYTENNAIKKYTEEINVRKGKGKGKGKSSSASQKQNVQDKPVSNISIGDAQSQGYNINELHKVPVIKEIGCSPEDWVFQKREKAKVCYFIWFGTSQLSHTYLLRNTS